MRNVIHNHCLALQINCHHVPERSTTDSLGICIKMVAFGWRAAEFLPSRIQNSGPIEITELTRLPNMRTTLHRIQQYIPMQRTNTMYSGEIGEPRLPDQGDITLPTTSNRILSRCTKILVNHRRILFSRSRTLETGEMRSPHWGDITLPNTSNRILSRCSRTLSSNSRILET